MPAAVALSANDSPVMMDFTSMALPEPSVWNVTMIPSTVPSRPM